MAVAFLSPDSPGSRARCKCRHHVPRIRASAPTDYCPTVSLVGVRAMRIRQPILLGLLLFAILLAASAEYEPLAGQERKSVRTRLKQAFKGKPVWTLDEAMAQLRLYPKDAYLQYVALQLARRENRLN